MVTVTICRRGIFDAGGREVINTRHCGGSVDQYIPSDVPRDWYAIHNGRKLMPTELRDALVSDGDDIFVAPYTNGAEFLTIFLISLLVSVVLTGISVAVQLLIAEDPDVGESDGINTLGPIQNTVANGTAIPVVLGEHRIGGQLIDFRTDPDETGSTRFAALYAVSEGRCEQIGRSVADENTQLAELNGQSQNANRWSDTEIDGNPISNYSGLSMSWRAGELEQSHIRGFRDTQTPNSVAVVMAQDEDADGDPTDNPGPWQSYTTQADVDAVKFIWRFPEGLWKQQGDGDIKVQQITYELRYRPATGGAWVYVRDRARDADGIDKRGELGDYDHVSTDTIGLPLRFQMRNTREAFTSFLLEFPERGTYEIERRRRNSGLVQFAVGTIYKPSEQKWEQQVYEWAVEDSGKQYGHRPPKRTNLIELSAVSEILDERLTYPGLALVGLRGIASEQVRGRLPNITHVVRGVRCGIWDGQDPDNPTLHYAWTRNPAWIACEVLLNDRWGLGKFYNVGDIVWEEWLAFADYCDELVSDGDGGTEPRCEYGGVLDKQRDGWDAVIAICKTANATPIRVAGRIGVKVERARDRVQLFGEGNIIEGSFSSKWLNPLKESNAVAVEFRDRANNWFVEVERAELDDAITNGERKREKTISLWGCDRATQAQRVARLSVGLLRAVDRIVNFEAHLDAVAIQPGDRFGVARRQRFGVANGRVLGSTSTTITLDQPLTLETGSNSHELVIRRGDDVQETRTITSGAGDYERGDTITVSPAFDVNPDDGDLYAIGRIGQSVVDFVCVSISTTTELTRRIVAFKYPGAGVYNAADGINRLEVPPVFVQPTGNEIPGDVVNLAAVNRYKIKPDGSGEFGLELFWQWPDQATTGRAVVYARAEDEPNFQNIGAALEPSFFWAGDLIPGTRYRFAVCSATEAGATVAPENAPQVVALYDGQSARPLTPTNLRSTRFGDTVRLVWDSPTLDADGDKTNVQVDRYEVRRGEDWRTAPTVGASASREVDVTDWVEGQQKMLVRAVTGDNVSSAGVAGLTLNLKPCCSATVTFEHDDRALGFAGTKIGTTVRADGTLATDATVATAFYVTPMIDLGESRVWQIDVAVDFAQEELLVDWSLERCVVVVAPSTTINVGETLTGATSSATAQVLQVANDNSGTLLLKPLTGTIQQDEQLNNASGVGVAGVISAPAALTWQDTDSALRDWGGPFDSVNIYDATAVSLPRPRVALNTSSNGSTVQTQQNDWTRGTVSTRYVQLELSVSTSSLTYFAGIVQQLRVVATPAAEQAA